jgi:DMSO/TMAO reductase YedYZ heme-binding membrane subunit
VYVQIFLQYGHCEWWQEITDVIWPVSYIIAPSYLGQRVKFMICFRKVPGSNLGRKIYYPYWGSP